MNRLGQRLDRVRQVRATWAVEQEIADLAVFYSLDPGEVGAELVRHQEHRARSGPEPVETTIQRLAAEYDLDPTELWAEYDRITARVGYPS